MWFQIRFQLRHETKRAHRVMGYAIVVLFVAGSIYSTPLTLEDCVDYYLLLFISSFLRVHFTFSFIVFFFFLDFYVGNS